jgi:ATP-dependent DNA helicase RecQ
MKTPQLQNELQNFLTLHFGHQDFRPGQQDALEAALNGRSLLGLMPTGSGKSLIYQYLTLYCDQPVLVISPLIALMQDQAQKANDLNIRAAFISSILSKEERQKRIQNLAQYKLVFVTPERFRKEDFVKAALAISWKFFVVDEAHCISMWGHDFRPDYSKLGEIRKKLGSPQVIALTATATSQAQKDIREKLGLVPTDPTIFKGIARPNLAVQVIEVVDEEGKKEELFEIVKGWKSDTNLIYFSLIQTLMRVSNQLRHMKIPHLVYHGDLPPQERKKILKIFQKEKNVLILATPAFGLGIDKANIRNVVHFELPGSLEAYFQEIGRAGRDGDLAQATLLYNPDDLMIQMEFIKWANPEKSFIQTLFRLIQTNQEKLNQVGVEFLKEQMTFKNRHDYRVEAALNIMEKGGVLESRDEPFPFTAIQEPGEDFFQQMNPAFLLKNQQTKLYDFVQWIKNTNDCRMVKIYDYFGDIGHKVCGHCDICRNRP